MEWYDILTEAELVELESLLDGDGGYEIEAPLIEDEDAWAFASLRFNMEICKYYDSYLMRDYIRAFESVAEMAEMA